MYSKHALALYAAIISSIVVASIFAISFVQEQQALAQGNKTGGSSGTSNHTAAGGNKTAGAAGSNRAGGNATGGGTAANATY